MSKVVRVQDFLVKKDPDKYKKMFKDKAENEKKEKAKQEAVEILPNENRELLKEIQLLQEEIKDLAGEKNELYRINKKLAKTNEQHEGYITDLKKIIDNKGDNPPDDSSDENKGDESLYDPSTEGENKKDDKKKSKRERERENK